MKLIPLTLVLLIASFVFSADGRKRHRDHFRSTRLAQLGSHPDCGRSLHYNNSNRIIGGRDAKPGEFPFEVYLEIHRDIARQSTSCSGSIIDEWHILTAAHCVTNYASQSNIVEVLAEIGSVRRGDAGSQVRSVRCARPNEGWIKTGTIDDIALLKVDQPIEFGLTRNGLGSVNPICLPSAKNDEVKVGDRVVAVGWGDQVYDQPHSTENLQTEVFRVVKDKAFRDSFRGDPEKEQLSFEHYEMLKKHEDRYFVTNRMSGRNSIICHGDSGGPTIRQTANGRYQVAGIASLGDKTCRIGRPALYTNVAYYLDWIESAKRNLDKDPYCTPPM